MHPRRGAETKLGKSVTARSSDHSLPAETLEQKGLSIMNSNRLVGFSSLLALALSACNISPVAPLDEVLVRSEIAGSPDAPTWVRGRIESSSSSLSFVGRGSAFNVLDEREAFDEAFMHARQQLAEYVGTRVQAEICDKDWAVGVRYANLRRTSIATDNVSTTERPNQSIASRTWQFSDAIVGQLLPADQYWEQWQVNSPSRHPMRRYKCWLLTTISTNAVSNFVASTVKALENEAEVARLQSEKDQLERSGVAQQEALAVSEAARQADAAEIQALRERVHYGRAFRLTATDNCPVDDSCISLDRSNWRTAPQIQPIVITPPAPAMPAPTKESCCELPQVGGR